MADIVEWLRKSSSTEWNGHMLNKAADEIERLRAIIQNVALAIGADETLVNIQHSSDQGMER